MGIRVVDLHLTGINFGILFCCAIFTTITMIAVIIRQKQTAEVRNFILFTLASAIALWADTLSYLAIGSSALVPINYAINVISYSASVFAALMFLMYVLSYFEERKGKQYPKWIKNTVLAYAVLCSILYMSSIWNHAFFYITESGIYHGTDLSYILGFDLVPLAVIEFVELFRNRKLANKRDFIILLLYNIVYLTLGLIDSAFVLTLHYIAMTAFILLIYIFISLGQEKELHIKQKELAVSELNALRLQMNPHFIYNTLASIDGLTMVDPDAARDLIDKFIKHLRRSYLDNSPQVVPFSQELENIQYYISVEKTRFPDLNIEFDLQANDFNIPPLTVQPIIENAIKHGICARDDSSGTITVATYETDKSYFIRITDNGVGFDINAPKKETGRSHLGITNTVKRLELICNGSLEVNSIVGVGTQVTITIPKE